MKTDKVGRTMQDAASVMGRRGGAARAKALTPKRRRQIARMGATARWAPKKGGTVAVKITGGGVRSEKVAVKITGGGGVRSEKAVRVRVTKKGGA